MRKWREENIEGVLTPALEKLGRARFETYGKSKNPDATFTLRISYGPASNYTVGTTTVPFRTTFYGLYDRAVSLNNQPPFNLARRWVGMDKKLDLSTPFNFVCTADIIGGNSGSPMINARGELVGLTFVRQRDTVFVQIVVIELLLRFLELQSLVFRRRFPPHVDLLRCRCHHYTTSLSHLLYLHCPRFAWSSCGFGHICDAEGLVIVTLINRLPYGASSSTTRRPVWVSW
ncbi:hypothetical protein ES708_33813 [subsurface metagenome]